VDITNGICKNCYCLATPEDIKQFHLLNKDKKSKHDENRKCPCGHLLSDHSNASILSKKLMKYYIDLEHSHEDDDALLKIFKKTKREPVNINVLMNLEISQFNKISCFMEICDYLLFADIVKFDSAFNNHEFRRSWTAFLKNKYEFRVVIIGHCLDFSYIKKLLHFYVWLYKRNYKVCYIQMMTSIYDVDASESEQYFKQMLDNNELANVFDGCKSLIFNSSGKYVDALYNITKMSVNTFRSLEELDLRTNIESPSRSIIDNDVTIIIKNCPMLSRISLDVYSDQVTGLCDSLKKHSKSLTMLDLEHPQDPFYDAVTIVIYSFYLLKDLPLETLHLTNYKVHNDDITILVNSCSHLHELHLIGITFDNKIISSWNSSSMKALTLRNCYYMKTEDMILSYTNDDYIFPKAYSFRRLEHALHHIEDLKDTQDGTCEFKTIKKLDFMLKEVSWPIYDSSFYDDFLLEFQEMNLINLNYFDVTNDTLVNEKSLMKEIIQKGKNLKKLLIFNWHLTDLLLDSISQSCPRLREIFLCIDDLRMTELGLKRLIDNCKNLRCIIFYQGHETSYDIPDFKILYYVFEDICKSKGIKIKFSHEYNFPEV
jgi:hypothetical protein